MKTLLRIDSSARIEGSRSRRLGDALEARWRAGSPDGAVVRRDLAADPVPHIEATTIAGFFTPADQVTDAMRAATVLSDRLIGEVEAADALLITAPMYNFGLPSTLKAWIDHVVRIHRTVAYDGTTFRGLVTGKAAYVALAYGAGSYEPGGTLAPFDYAKPYLTHVLGFIGFRDIEVVGVEGTSGEEGAAAAALDAALKAIENLPSLAA
ncbi:NAD(P)H dehydrogenase (quinone) [Xanthobacter versatilis]|uniref:FMN-dependent NADH:quinone oxidoreductase n=1 Tax=Xanthobacter autotrophicus (strain ATCC BAA-1158 / Py2) TaxID=78245 RepID=AZOR_XANP2|nr:RecName: Full=FMN-dependent NADH:quinone oxidoreductase; AltName: Full=Azo-dye reductase; AltName: Full=FMN-dependent NADH-azo compound oxidoreductase; AltName: Full=FMN-dependent NADH-azoreductase [Xanthobacter autotrophicus Py2]ABS66224.1 NAD(P)H dehydrogenase (quinone) [Xanthobacter autotrophicus Py2]